MKKLLSIVLLAMAASPALADGFAPWENRGAPQDTVSDIAAVAAPAGFAPWRDRTVAPDRIDTEVRFTDYMPSAFRPWS